VEYAVSGAEEHRPVTWCEEIGDGCVDAAVGEFSADERGPE
jgi:hypothetical protein